MIIVGVLVGVVLAGLELGVAWILACVINYEPSSEKKEEKEKSFSGHLLLEAIFLRF